jgi:tRNA(Ile)-lysidine synthase
LLPLLRKKYQPALDKTVLRVMEITGKEAELVTQAAREWLRSQRGRVAPFGEIAIAVQRRCLQLQLLSHGIAAGFDLVEQLRNKLGQAITVGKEGDNISEAVCAVRDAAGIVHLHTSNPMEFRDGSQELELATSGEVVFDRAKVQWQVKPGKFVPRLKARAGSEVFDADKIGRRIILRHWRPGDRFQPIGMDASVKLQDIFTNQRVQRPRRHELIVATTAQNEIFWVEGLRIAERFKLTKSTIRRLQWRWQRL